MATITLSTNLFSDQTEPTARRLLDWLISI
jgi:hypothetical protein